MPREIRVSDVRPPDLVPAEVAIPLDCLLAPAEMTEALVALHLAKGHGNAEVTFTFHRVGETVQMVKANTLLKD
jgi:hypothetical protein